MIRRAAPAFDVRAAPAAAVLAQHLLRRAVNPRRRTRDSRVLFIVTSRIKVSVKRTSPACFADCFSYAEVFAELCAILVSFAKVATVASLCLVFFHFHFHCFQS